MSEAELHVLRARLNGGIRNKAVRGELRRGLPVGFVWGDADGEVRFHPDEAVVTAIRSIFAKFAETGSARRVWLWFRSEGLPFPMQMHQGHDIRWVDPSYTAIHHVLTNPVYAGAYTYGKTRTETVLDAGGERHKRIRHLPRSDWQVLIPNHHPGFIDWETYEANQARIAQNTRSGPHKEDGAVREGSALLQGLGRCGHCGRRLRTHYHGRLSSSGAVRQFIEEALDVPPASESSGRKTCPRLRSGGGRDECQPHRSHPAGNSGRDAHRRRREQAEPRGAWCQVPGAVSCSACCRRSLTALRHPSGGAHARGSD
jgi:Recombinase